MLGGGEGGDVPASGVFRTSKSSDAELCSKRLSTYADTIDVIVPPMLFLFSKMPSSRLHSAGRMSESAVWGSR